MFYTIYDLHFSPYTLVVFIVRGVMQSIFFQFQNAYFNIYYFYVTAAHSVT